NKPSANGEWIMTQDGWNAEDGFAPTCPEPFQMTTPVNLAQVTAVLYPGQIRGGDYKAHGGFRFDSVASNAVPVVIPITGRIVQGARYLENSDVQYMFEIIHPCGMMIRFDHLLTLSPKFAAIAETLPVAQTDDSRTTQINPPVDVAAGEVMATAIGQITDGKNVFVDWGVYDLRTKNQVSADPAWKATHDPQLAQHAVCWFDLLSAEDESRIRALPAGDSTSGNASDFCR
ncbi:MAG: hypothetical protein AAB733_02280, partial [Patescibacteria group bacterium]